MHCCASFLRQSTGDGFAILPVFKAIQILFTHCFFLLFFSRANIIIEMKEIDRNMIILCIRMSAICVCVKLKSTDESFRWVLTAANYFAILDYAVCMEVNWIWFFLVFNVQSVWPQHPNNVLMSGII